MHTCVQSLHGICILAVGAKVPQVGGWGHQWMICYGGAKVAGCEATLAPVSHNLDTVCKGKVQLDMPKQKEGLLPNMRYSLRGNCVQCDAKAATKDI